METNQEKQLPAVNTQKAVLRDKWVGVRFTVSEYAAVKKKAKEAGITLSRFLRQAVNGATILRRLSDEDLGHVRQLSGMASNLNQLAHKANAEGFTYTAESVAIQGGKIQELLTKLKL